MFGMGYQGAGVGGTGHQGMGDQGAGDQGTGNHGVERPEPIYRAMAIAEGIDDYRLRRMCVNDQLSRVRPGAFIEPTALEGLFPEDRHRIELVATARALRRPAVISHASAAVMHGLPIWNMDLRLAHFTRAGAAGGYATTRTRMHMAPLSEDEIVEVDGHAVTSVARTVVDLARSEPFEQAVVGGDGALNLGLVTAEELDEARLKLRHHHGFRAAGKAIAFMDHRSESVGESRSRVIMHRLGLPKPDLQRVIRRGYVKLARVDFHLPEQGVVGEFDGRGKYERGRRAGESQGNVVAREKQRENAIRGTGAEVVRWEWRDLGQPWLIRHKFEEAFALARQRPPPDWDEPWPEDSYAVRRR